MSGKQARWNVVRLTRVKSVYLGTSLQGERGRLITNIDRQS